MNNLQIFENKEFGNIRSIMIDGEPWWVAKDIADILGYSNSRDAIGNHVDEDDKANVVIHDGSQNRNMTAINESGLYSMILSSKLESAKKFKKWVTSEVLPSIRKHGMYAKDELLDNPDLLFDVVTKLRSERKARLEAEKQALALQEELDYSKEWLSIKRVANQNGVSWKTFDWRKLKVASAELGINIKKIFDANYGEVNTYHKDAWELAYPTYEV